ncbi:hypothetical protein RJ639_027219 [Escallonia herrerae]|uniref:Uncharacterized protein n=1 Tax=Escallonia herrerae TaxID=1293975 RepID=A0AA89BG45_9ASTE|nr:hypothetical protein RJ639_027219 [Escallonia herrerae]
MSSSIHQISCFSSLHRNLHHLRTRYHHPCTAPLPLKVSGVMSHDHQGTDISSSEGKATLSYVADASKSHDEISSKLYPSIGEHENEKGISDPAPHTVTEQKRAAKIHDFCFGIPFGGLVLSGGIVGFIFSRNPATLGTGVLYGGALLGLSTFSLKIWRQGKSSLPFILGQAILAAALIWKNFATYSLTKKLFPTGFFGVISAAMLCFYAYVVMSGGNAPPKKLKSSAAVPS